MKKFLLIILLGVVSLLGDDFENGLKAYGQNDFMAAKKLFP